MLQSNWYRGRMDAGGPPVPPPPPTFDPLVHPNLTGFYDFTNVNQLSTWGGVSPGVPGGDISQVNDQSGHGRHLLQLTQSDCPILQQDGDGISYGRFQFSKWMKYYGIAPCSTVIFAVRLDGGGVNNGKAMVMDDAKALEHVYMGGAFRNLWYEPYNQWRLHLLTHDKMSHTATRVWANQVQTNEITYDAKMVFSCDVQGITGVLPQLNTLIVGDIPDRGDYYMRGNVYFLAMFDAVLSDTDRQNYETYAASLMEGP